MLNLFVVIDESLALATLQPAGSILGLPFSFKNNFFVGRLCQRQFWWLHQADDIHNVCKKAQLSVSH